MSNQPNSLMTPVRRCSEKFTRRHLFCAAVMLACFCTWGCKKVSGPALTTGQTDKGLTLKTNTIIGVNEFYVAVCNINSDQIEVYDPNDATWNSSTVKLAWKPTTALNFTTTEVSAWGNPADVKQRRVIGFDGQSTYYAVAGGHLAAIFNRADNKKVWAHAFTTEFPRAMELMPNGNVAVAAYSAGWVRVYASSQGPTNNTYAELPLANALGLLYDPYNDILWAIGTNALKAYRVYGGATPHFSEVTTMSKALPSGSTGRDINCYFGDINKLCISTTTGTYIFNKTTGTFTATAGASFQTDAIGFSNQPDGSLVACNSTTAVVSFYNSSGALSYTRTVTGGLFYRAKTSGEYYQTSNDYTIATFNIRGQKTTAIPAPLIDHSWQERQVPLEVDVIKRYNFDIIAFQEPFKWQVQGLLNDLGGYSRFGYSDDGGNLESTDTENHHHDIFYRTNMFTVQASGRFWFAAGGPTSPPAGLDDGWGDGGKAKVCVWLKLQDKITLQSFYVFCAHFYYALGSTRLQSANMVLTKVPSILSANGSAPVIFMGDLNTAPGDGAWNVLENSTLLQDAYDWAGTNTPVGYRSTDCNDSLDVSGKEIWRIRPQDMKLSKQQHQIDNIFLTSEWQTKVVSHAAVWDSYINGSENKAFSDHVAAYVVLHKP